MLARPLLNLVTDDDLMNESYLLSPRKSIHSVPPVLTELEQSAHCFISHQIRGPWHPRGLAGQGPVLQPGQGPQGMAYWLGLGGL